MLGTTSTPGALMTFYYPQQGTLALASLTSIWKSGLAWQATQPETMSRKKSAGFSLGGS